MLNLSKKDNSDIQERKQELEAELLIAWLSYADESESDFEAYYDLEQEVKDLKGLSERLA